MEIEKNYQAKKRAKGKHIELKKKNRKEEKKRRETYYFNRTLKMTRKRIGKLHVRDNNKLFFKLKRLRLRKLFKTEKRKDEFGKNMVYS